MPKAIKDYYNVEEYTWEMLFFEKIILQYEFAKYFCIFVMEISIIVKNFYIGVI